MLISKTLLHSPGCAVLKPVESFAGLRVPFAPKRLVLVVLFACAVGSVGLAPADAQAAGLGRLNVQSGLGQPLRAEVEITSESPDELQSLQVKLASPEAFKQAGLELNSALLGIQVAVERIGTNRAVVRLSSAQPLNEPYIDLLLELVWSSGRLVREYTFLLDPPELRLGRAPEPTPPAVAAPKPAPASKPAVAVQPAPAPVAPAPAKPGAAPVATAKPAGESADYTVKRGDTLSKIADQMRPEGVTLDQMLVSLFRDNPQAFIGNMNRLKTGAVLRAPDAAQAAGVAPAEARRIVVAQTADFAAYRAKLAGGVAAGAAGAAEGEQRSATGQVTAKVEDQAGAKAGAGDQVKLARPQDAATKGTGGGSVAARADATTTTKQAITEARQREAELERNVKDLRGLVAAPSKAGAEAQKTAEAAKAADAKKAEAPAAAAPKAEDAKKPGDAAKAGEAPQGADAQKSEQPAAASDAAPAKPAEPVKPAPKPTPAPAESEPAFWENPLVLGGAALIVALLGGYAAYSRSRKKRFEKFQDSILTGGDLKANSIFGTTGGQTVDTADSTFNSNFTPSASQIDSNEVDPIAEADVYIAYGRDAQAEEILKEALKNSPERDPIRVKLLEIYANRRDLPAFEAIAGELYSRTNGQGEDWDKAAALGRSLEPRNPLYGGASATTATTAGVGALAGAGAIVDTNATVPGFVDTSTAPVDVDFDLGFDQAPAAEASASHAAPSLHMEPPTQAARSASSDTVPMPTIDFDLDSLAQPMASMTEAAPAPSADKGAGLDFDLSLPDTVVTTPPPVPSQTPAFDLSGITLDLEPAKGEPLSGKQQEMATKLDLAAAYQEIGDQEGAKELLDEVVRGGSPAQQQQARQMLQALA